MQKTMDIDIDANIVSDVAVAIGDALEKNKITGDVNIIMHAAAAVAYIHALATSLRDNTPRQIELQIQDVEKMYRILLRDYRKQVSESKELTQVIKGLNTQAPGK